MIKSKKLFARALYLVFALALVAGLTLVPATPVSAGAITPITVTPLDNSAGATTDYSIAFTPATGEATTITIDFSAFGTTGTDMVLSAVSTTIGAYAFTGFSVNPSGVTVDDGAAKTIVFTGGTVIAGSNPTITNAVAGTGLRITNDRKAETKDVTITTTSDSGTYALTIVPAAASDLTVEGITDPIPLGTSSDVKVTAYDTYDNLATGYTGTIAFTSTDGDATLPADYTFIAGDDGTKTFTGGVTFFTLGERTVTATDTVTSGITGVQTAITVGDPTDVWVDDDWVGTVAGTEVESGKFFSRNAFATIQDGIDAVAGSTVNVAAGDYPEMITIAKGLTLLGANADIHPAVGTNTTETVGTRGAETILSHEGTKVVQLQADDITIDGFKFTTTGHQTIYGYADSDNFHLTNCIFDTSESFVSGGVIEFSPGPGFNHTDCVFDFNLFQDPGQSDWGGTIYTGGDMSRLRIAYNTFIVRGYSVSWAAIDGVGVIIEGNEFDGTIDDIPTWRGYGNIDISRGGNIIIRDNWFHDGDSGLRVGIVGGSITGNTFEEIYWYDILLYGGWDGSQVSDDVLIEDNTIIYNDVTTTRDKHGIALAGVDGSTIHIHNNNFIDGEIYPDVFAVAYGGVPVVDALYNWWGDETGPEHATLNTGAQGGSVSDNVNFSPWLYEPKENFVSGAPCYAGSVVLDNEATAVDTSSYMGGWNSFSTPITLDDSADYISEILDLLTAGGRLSIVRAQRFDLASQDWVPLVMGGTVFEDYQIKPGEGFFIQVSTNGSGSLPILCKTTPTSPPMRNLVAGQNLIGLSNLTSMTVANALSGVTYNVLVSPSPPNAAAWSVPPSVAASTDMLLGEVYWLAMSQAGFLFGFTTTPVADTMTWELNQ